MKNIKQLSFVLIATLLLFSCKKDAEFQSPNVLLIQVDDLGYGDLGLHGNTIIETPSIDKLGKNSIRFDQFYVSSVCAPTRAALLTGRNYLRTGVSGVHAGRDFVNLDETIIAETFKEAGYTTGMWGKWHSGKTDGYFPWDRGFDEAYYSCLYNYFDNSGLMNGKELKTEGYTTDAITDMAITFIEKNKTKPFFAYLSHLAPHNPWRAPQQYIDKYLEKGLSEPMATLYGMIDNVDYNIGRVLETLEKNNLKDNTIVVFLSDNGPWIRSYRFGLTEEEWKIRNVTQLRGTKGTNWENGIRSPLFISWGDKLKSRSISTNTKVEDLFPTLCHLAGITINDRLKLDGQALLDQHRGYIGKEAPVFIAAFTPIGEASFRNEKDKYAQAVPFTQEYIETFDVKNQKLGMRDGTYKLITEIEDAGLYNLLENPFEDGDKRSTNAEKEQQMLDEINQWYEPIKSSGKAFTMPEFQIGYKGRDMTYIYCFGPSSISKKLINKEHFLANWGDVSEQANYSIRVHEGGKFKVSMIHEIKNFDQMCFEVSTHKEKTSQWLSEEKDRDFGTLIKEESAYWDNFDKKETFRTSIIKSNLGQINLTPKDTTLMLSLIDTKGKTINDFKNRIIALQLIRVSDSK